MINDEPKDDRLPWRPVRVRLDDDGRDVTSVLARGAVRVYWEDAPGEHAVTQIGRYE